MLEDHKEKIIDIMTNVYYLVKKKSPLRHITDLCDLSDLQGTFLGEKYVNDHAARDFALALAHVLRTAIITAAIAGPCLGLMIDESTDISSTGQMVLYLRVLIGGKFKTVFWRLASVTLATADGLVALLTLTFEADGIPTFLVSSFASV